MEKKTTLFNWIREINYNDYGYHRIGLIEMSRLDSNSILFEDSLNIRMSVLNPEDKFCCKTAYSVIALKPMKTFTNVRDSIRMYNTGPLDSAGFLHLFGFPLRNVASEKFFSSIGIGPIIRNMELLLSQ